MCFRAALQHAFIISVDILNVKTATLVLVPVYRLSYKIISENKAENKAVQPTSYQNTIIDIQTANNCNLLSHNNYI